MLISKLKNPMKQFKTHLFFKLKKESAALQYLHMQFDIK